jgi:hypothetical protein
MDTTGLSGAPPTVAPLETIDVAPGHNARSLAALIRACDPIGVEAFFKGQGSSVISVRHSFGTSARRARRKSKLLQQKWHAGDYSPPVH